MLSLVLTIFVIFAGQMFFQNLSIGKVMPEPDPFPEEPVITEPNPQVSQMPEAPNNTQPESLLTNHQKYYKQLVTPGSTNILIIASDPTSFSFDTIMVLSIDKTSRAIHIISFPRDIYIDYSQAAIDEIKAIKPERLQDKGWNKINAVPSIGNAIGYKKNVGRFGKPYVDFLADVIGEVFDIQVEDYIYVRVDGFRKIVDFFGGVKIHVPILMNYFDPTQDLDIYIEPGTQVLRGKDAEGFVRFRQGYDANGVFFNKGDLYRKENQIRFMKAFIQQHVTLANLNKLSKVSEIITQNVITSVKGWSEIVAYGALAEEAINKGYPIEGVPVDCSDKTINGVSYVLIKQTDSANE